MDEKYQNGWEISESMENIRIDGKYQNRQEEAERAGIGRLTVNLAADLC
jgi:hypothetical protein